MQTTLLNQKNAGIAACLGLAVALAGCRTQPPRFHPPQGIYVCPQEVKLSAKDEHTKIFYTTDSSRPTRSSSRYKGPFLVANTQTVKAIAQEEDEEPSKVKSRTYACRPQVNRADIALLLQQAFSLPQPARAAAYADVHPTDLIYPAAQAITPFLGRQVLCPNCLLSANFSPQRPTSRAEAAITLVNILIAAKKVQLLSTADANSVLNGVPDAGGLPAFARRYVATAIQIGVLLFKNGNTLQPGQPYSHAELAMALDTIRTKFGPIVITGP